MSRAVRPSPVNTWPRCPPQLAQRISVRRPSASGWRLTAPGISSSKLGQPQCGLELAVRQVQRRPALPAEVDALGGVVPVLARERPLGALVQDDALFLGRQGRHIPPTGELSLSDVLFELI